MGRERYKKVRKVLYVTLALNLSVAVLKAFFGLLSNSISMMADALHSFFDSTSNIVGLVAMKMASKPPDRDHPYGHRKYETMATVAIVALLVLACIEILENAVRRILDTVSPEITYVTISIMVFSTVVNYFVSRYEQRKGRELDSNLLIADSMHTRTDIYASLSVLIGFAMVKLGYPILDPLIALMIVLLIGRVGYRILRESSDVLCDKSMLDESDVRKVLKTINGVRDYHNIRTRGPAGDVYVDLHITLNPGLSIEEGHRISELVEAELKKKIHGVKDVLVHIEPDN